MYRFLLLFALCSSPALADRIVTFTFPNLPLYDIPTSFTIPSTLGPQFSITVNGTQWNYLFTGGDHYADVSYNDFYVSAAGSNGGVVFALPFYCAPDNNGCLAGGIPWDGSNWVPGHYGSIGISVATPEPATLILLLVGVVLFALKGIRNPTQLGHYRYQKNSHWHHDECDC